MNFIRNTLANLQARYFLLKTSARTTQRGPLVEGDPNYGGIYDTPTMTAKALRRWGKTANRSGNQGEGAK